MAKKILFCATVDYHFKAFHLPYMKWFKEQGWQVDVASAGNMNLPYTDTKHTIPIERSPFHLSNRRAYQELREIITKNKYEILHCHTPLGGVMARLAAKEARKKGMKVIYTAHGFHFCKGSSKLNWVIYYPIEKYLAKRTDVLITINQEDYDLAEKHRFKAEEIVQIHGVGVNTDTYKPVKKSEKESLKKSFGYRDDEILLFYAAEFNKNKNQHFLLDVLSIMKKEVPEVRLLLAGEGPLLESCQARVKELKLKDHVDFLGFRKDIDTILSICDIAVASSFREGLPVNVMEAMACALPVVAIDNRGHRELITNYETGWLLNREDSAGFADKLVSLAKNEEERNQFGLNGRKTILETYSTKKVLMEQTDIYKSYMEEGEEAAWALH